MKKFILIVDDDNLTYSLLSPLLSDDCTVILHASTGTDALKWIEAFSVDLCLLALLLPDMSGLDLMKVIREKAPRAGIIMMDGSHPDDATLKAVREHALHLLAKPFNLFQVKAVVEEILGKHIDTYQDHNFLMTRLSGEKRLHDRKPFTNPWNYTILSTDSEDDRHRCYADTVDICVNGLGITTNAYIEPGRIIRLKNESEHVRGIVRWVTPSSASDRYRAGIQFI